MHIGVKFNEKLKNIFEFLQYRLLEKKLTFCYMISSNTTYNLPNIVCINCFLIQFISFVIDF